METVYIFHSVFHASDQLNLMQRSISAFPGFDPTTLPYHIIIFTMVYFRRNTEK